MLFQGTEERGHANVVTLVLPHETASSDRRSSHNVMSGFLEDENCGFYLASVSHDSNSMLFI